VDYLLRSHACPEEGFPCTIEDAKAFIWLWQSEWGVSKIGQVWETYKLAAPYLYALHLEKTFRPNEVTGVDDALDWIVSFVKSRRRVDRFLGRAAFAMDVLKEHAGDQRECDFVDIPRVQPLLRRFSGEEKLVSDNVDRNAEHHGRSFRHPTPPAAAR
jgi:hypothetical protein